MITMASLTPKRTVRFSNTKSRSLSPLPRGKSPLPRNKIEYFTVAETLNGRAAMLAWDLAILKQWVTGDDIVQQFDTTLPEVTFISLLLTFATFFTLKSSKEELSNIWTKEAELLNGRSAMVGILLLSVYEIMMKHYT